MANSKLLKEAIADAKSVRETAIANAKIALEEAFTPRLQSILSQKLQAEMEEEEEADMVEDLGDDSSEIGDGDNKEPQDGEVQSADGAHTELDPETEEETAEVGEEAEEVEKVSEGEEEVEEGEEVEESYHEGDDEDSIDEEDEDELDLAEIIRELEEELAEMGNMEEEDEVEDGNHEEAEVEEAADDVDVVQDVDDPHSYNEEEEVEESELEEEDDEEEIDLEEILREMGYGDDEEEVTEEEEEDHSAHVAEIEDELEEAYATIKELQSTINEVNLLNAKLLYTNKLFRSYELTNEQKMKVVETLDRTGNVREVKLVYSTLAESFKYNNGTVTRKPKTKITESFASKATRSTAPQKEIISESTNAMAERFKKLANIK